MSFGVKYLHSGHPDNTCAVDWDIWEKGRWVRSWKDSCGVRWYREDEDGGALGSIGYEAILEKFGLQDFRTELPPEEIEFMSPAVLMKFRAQKGLPHLAILSDTAGDYEPAERHK